MLNIRRSVIALITAVAGTTSAIARADDCARTITGNDMMQYSQKELAVPASCKQVQLTLKHTGSAGARVMGHDWVLAKSSDVVAIANSGITAGPADNYLPAGDKRVIAATKIIGGGETTTIVFSTASLKPGGDYTFFCSMPGHHSMMRGRFVFG